MNNSLHLRFFATFGGMSGLFDLPPPYAHYVLRCYFCCPLQKLDQLMADKIAWLGYIDTLSCLIPRSCKHFHGGGRQKHPENLPAAKPGHSPVPLSRSDLSESPKTPSNRKTSGNALPIFGRCLVAAFVKPEVVCGDEAWGDNESVFELGFSNRKHADTAVPRWILRFRSANDAAEWLSHVDAGRKVDSKKLEDRLSSSGKVWMISEQSEIFWTSKNRCHDSEDISWTKVRLC